MIPLAMIFSFIKIGLFSFGGGYAILAMIQQETVIKHGWLTQAEFTDIVAISQMTPGPIAINAATFIGFQKGGILGSVVCTFSLILPSLVIMLAITLTYMKLKHQPWFKNVMQKLRWLSLGLIGAAMILIGQSSFGDVFSVGVFLLCFTIYMRFKINPFYMLLGAGVVGFFFG
ncbi:MAG: chromate transporter [Candidatus Cloacimonadaceae bacterium]|nr:chromate transporter [Candidatus Cloacimonadaceae bacterium]